MSHSHIYLEDNASEPRDLLDVDLDLAGESLASGVVTIGIVPVDDHISDPIKILVSHDSVHSGLHWGDKEDTAVNSSSCIINEGLSTKTIDNYFKRNTFGLYGY